MRAFAGHKLAAAQEAKRQNIFLRPFIGRPPAGEPRGVHSAWARGCGVVVCRRRAQLVGNMHARILAAKVQLTIAGELEKGIGVSTRAKWRRLERLDFSSAMERTTLALGST